MTEHEASRTLVKSPPELWAECSDASSLARHLEQFGELRITRIEPETAVAWEGENASGTVRLEPSGWGTRVIITARAAGSEPVDQALEEIGDPPDPPDPPEPADPDPDPDPAPEPEPLPPAASLPSPPEGPRLGLLARVRRWFRGPEPEVAAPQPEIAAPEPETPEPESETGTAEPESETGTAEPAADPADAVTGVLSAALDSLGQAHHRPFSRA